MNFVYFYDKTAKKGYNSVVSVQHARTPFQLKKTFYDDINETLQLDYGCSPVVLPVPVVDCLGVVHDVEQTRPSDHELKGGGQSGPGWKNVFVAPAPVGPGAGPTHGHRALAPAGQPSGELLHLDLPKRGVLGSIVDGGVVGSVDLEVVLLGKLANSERHLDNVPGDSGTDNRRSWRL